MKQEQQQQQEGEEDEEEEDEMDVFYPQALAGFVMVLTEEGDMIFLTENVNKHIGVTQVQQSRTIHTHIKSPLCLHTELNVSL